MKSTRTKQLTFRKTTLKKLTIAQTTRVNGGGSCSRTIRVETDLSCWDCVVRG